MLEMTLTNGGFKVRDSKKKGRLFVKWPSERYPLPNGQYSYVPPKVLPSIETFYTRLKAEGFSNDAILAKLINLYVPWRLFHVGHLEGISKVIGWIGYRGSNKTSSMVYTAIFDFLIRGLPVFSNVDVIVKVRYRDCEKIFESKPWKGVDMLELEDCEGGAVLSDEINLAGGAEGSRFMSGANLEWANQMQQIRKRQLNILYTAQSYNNLDPRLKFQSDYIIECQDCFNDHSYKAICPGDKTKWEVYEISGLSGRYDLAYEVEHRNLRDYAIWKGMIWLRPVSWPAYDTFKEQKADYIHQFKMKQAYREYRDKVELIAAREQPNREVVKRLLDDGKLTFWADELWETLEADRARQSSMGKVLTEYYDKKRDSDSGRYYYTLKENGNGKE